MKTREFNLLCECFANISKMNDDAREIHFKCVMSKGYLFLDMTEKQVRKIKNVLQATFPEKFRYYDKPDEHGYTAEFEYLKFK